MDWTEVRQNCRQRAENQRHLNGKAVDVIHHPSIRHTMSIKQFHRQCMRTDLCFTPILLHVCSELSPGKSVYGDVNTDDEQGPSTELNPGSKARER